MCQAFSCLITKSGKVYWKAGMDSHDKLQAEFVKIDKELEDNKEAPENTFARIEVSPKNGKYLDLKNKWIYKIDEKVKPEWLDDSFEVLAEKACEEWKKQVYTFNLKEALNPIHPFKIKPPKITKKEIDLVKQWASVWASVRASVGDSAGDSVGASVWASVRDSVWASVGTSVRDSVRDSVWDSVWAYIGHLFPLEEWEYIDYKNPLFKKGVYPFESTVKLWKKGLIASFDGMEWRLHGNEKAEVLWKGKV